MRRHFMTILRSSSKPTFGEQRLTTWGPSGAFVHAYLRRGILALSLAMLGIAGVSSALVAQEADNTGTNPINFTFDWRAYMELQSLRGGDNALVVQTVEQRIPLSQSTQFRFRARRSTLSLDPERDGTSTETSGIGDWDARFLYVPKVGERGAIAVGVEGGFPTATNARLGSGKYTLGPQVFGVLFAPPGGGVLIAPAYQLVFSYAGDEARSDVLRSQFDLFYLWLASSSQWWVLVNPQGVIDHENDVSFGLLEAEYGRMILGGLSSYVRPSFGLGADRPYAWSAEFGFKAVWR